MATKRVKISFESKSPTIIERAKIASSNKRVKETMRKAARAFEKKEAKSQQDAADLILNS